MQPAGFGRRRRRRRGAAALAAAVIALAVSGCSSASNPGDATVDTPLTSRFTSVFSGPASPPAQAAAGGPTLNDNDCPSIELRTGAGTYTVSGNPPQASVTDVRYQVSLTQVARQCTAVGGNLAIKVGLQGRIVVGPAGGPGQVDLPLRYAVVQEGLTPRTIATKFKRLPADVPPGQSNVMFSDVDESLSFPMPSRAELAGYMVYVGFDEIGDGPEKKPA
ncbi:MAG TPA: hypothetical protein VIY51_26890, partial [Xanthobacteraceae bacterium]